jgi:hypothetical protein
MVVEDDAHWGSAATVKDDASGVMEVAQRGSKDGSSPWRIMMVVHGGQTTASGTDYGGPSG